MEAALTQPSFLRLQFITIFFSLITVVTSHANNSDYAICSREYRCGDYFNISISYPFWGGGRPQFCGIQDFQLRCTFNLSTETQIRINDVDYDVRDIDYRHYTMRLERIDLNGESWCPTEKLLDSTFNYSLYEFWDKAYGMATLFYNCSNITSPWDRYAFNCINSNRNDSYFMLHVYTALQNPFNASQPLCEYKINVPVLNKSYYRFEASLIGGFNVGYKLKYKNECDECVNSGGICGSARNETQEFICYFLTA